MRLLVRERGKARIVRERRVGQRAQPAAGIADDRPERLEARPGAGAVAGEQERALPEALASDRVVGLRIDREQQAAMIGGLRDPVHDHQRVAVGIGVDDAGTQGVACQLHRVEVGGVVGERGARAAGLHGVHEPACVGLEGRERVGPPARSLHHGGRVAARRLARGPAVASAHAERQTDLPREVGAQKVRQVGAIRRGRQRGAAARVVLAELQVVVKKIPPGIPQGILQRREAERFGRGCVEQPFDPGRVEGLRPPIPRQG